MKWTHWYPIGKSFRLQSESSVSIPRQSMVMEPARKGRCNVHPIKIHKIMEGRLFTQSLEINSPIIMFTFSGSSPDSHFLLRLMPSRSTSTLRVTSNSDTTLKKKKKNVKNIRSQFPFCHKSSNYYISMGFTYQKVKDNEYIFISLLQFGCISKLLLTSPLMRSLCFGQ